MKKLLVLFALICKPILAQHEHMPMPMPMPKPTPQMPQTPDLTRDLLMQEGSGTSHDPAAAPMHMSMTMIDKWMLMDHGLAFVTQTVQTGRGSDQFFSTNWFMGSAERPLAGGHLMLRSMLSLEPLTVGKRGYPEPFQEGEGLTDRQHPHDFFMELAAQYAVRIEASAFHGAEPDENRWKIDGGPIDSASGRLTFTPTSSLVAQVSFGYLTKPGCGP